MVPVKTQFLSKAHGFHFPNRFELSLPVKFQLPFGANVDLSQVVYGLCGGMCFTALDYYHRSETPPDWGDPKAIDWRLFIYLCQRQLDSMRITTLLKIFDYMMSEDAALGMALSKKEIPALKRILDKGEPAVLALIRVKGLDDPTQNHQVMATGYEYDPEARRYTIHLYDPNHPNAEPYLTVDLPGSKTGFRISQSTGEGLRGFFVIPYTYQGTAPKYGAQPRELSFTRGLEEPAFQLCWPVDSRRVNQYFGENPDTYKPFGLPGHEGLDFYALSGANVYAAAEGEVMEAGEKPGHPYGTQVRLKHAAAGKSFYTTYAHLSRVQVAKGQKVKAGELIGLADNTGNSFGSHLHLTLKVDGAKTPGYPAGIVDPWPYLAEATQPASVPAEGGLAVFTRMMLNLRSGPNLESSVMALLPAGERLSAQEDAQSVQAKLGQQDQWLAVTTPGGLSGYVAAWLVQGEQQAFPPTDIVVYPHTVVNLRSGPGTAFSLLTTLTAADPLVVLGDEETAVARLGKMGEWLQVETAGGMRGYAAAWLVHRTGQTPPPAGFTVYPTAAVNIRARPALEANILTVAVENEPLRVLGDPAQARSVVGMADQWLSVKTPTGFSGYVAAWMVRQAPNAPPASPPAAGKLQVTAISDANLRAQPSINSPRVDGAYQGDTLLVLEADLLEARGKVGANGQWLHVQKENGNRGWMAAWLAAIKE